MLVGRLDVNVGIGQFMIAVDGDEAMIPL